MSKYVTLKQMIEIIKAHIVTVCPMFIIGMLILAGVVTHNLGSVIFSVIAVIIYFFAIYDKALYIAQKDKKKYTEEQPYWFKGLLLPIGLLVLSVIVYLLYFVSWQFMSLNGSIVGMSGWINNFICIIWSFPYTGFMTLKDGYMSVSGHILMYLLPFVASFLGYYAGYRNYDISVTISKFIYAPKDKEKKDK